MNASLLREYRRSYPAVDLSVRVMTTPSQVAAVRSGEIDAGLVRSPVTVSLPGGDLVIRWAPGEPIVMSGAATRVYEGETDWAQFG